MTKTIFEKSQKGQRAYSLPKKDTSFQGYLPEKKYLRQTLIPLPEVSELDLTRHFCFLASRNVGIDNLFYPLGSCTMKLNPRINEYAASLSGFQSTHPFAPDDTVQGNLQVIFELIERLCAICGMTAGTLLPNAGAQGEFVGLQLIAAYHQKRGDHQRDEILIPDNAHGTNPASATMAGYKTITIKTTAQGDIDIQALKELVSEKTAGLMMTNPNTLGLFSKVIREAAALVHQAGGLLYYDGANLNPIMNVVRPGEMGFDVMHINLHKTFSTPHGGGGPGAAPVLCNNKLKPFLPVPFVQKDKEQFNVIWDCPESIGTISSFHGNFAIYLRAYLYALLHGHYGLRRVAELSVLNANYLKKRLEKLFKVPFPQYCMHEFVVEASNYLDKGVKAYDIAKRLLDYGFYAPTIYFPLIIKECMLIEPTECESKATLDQFVEALEQIKAEIEANPQIVQTAPHSKPVTRLDEVRAAKDKKIQNLG